jgi:hypothetical protein
VLLVEVGLGKVETVTDKDSQRKSPSSGYDSILVSKAIFMSYSA